MKTVVATFEIAKRYRGGTLAVDGVSLRVEEGEIYGFLGLNGAGKSTMIGMLLGMLAPSAGHAELFGERVRPVDTAIWSGIGYLVDSANVYPELTVRENLDGARLLQRVGDREAVDRVIEALSLGAYAARRARALSLGNLQRLALARALLHRPKLLVLDEPANGLDPAGVVEIRELLRRLARDEGVTVFMSSHVLAEVDRIATRIGVMHRGHLIEQLDAADLERRRRRRLEVGVRDPARATAALRAVGLSPRQIQPGADDGTSLLELAETRALERPDEVTALLAAAGVPPLRVAAVQEDLEEHFLRITRGADVRR